jgi:hypothetical protein
MTNLILQEQRIHAHTQYLSSLPLHALPCSSILSVRSLAPFCAHMSAAQRPPTAVIAAANAVSGAMLAAHVSAGLEHVPGSTPGPPQHENDSWQLPSLPAPSQIA